MSSLTERTIRALKPQGSRIALRDNGTPGLELRVGKGGTKTFAVRYTLADGTRRRLNLGRWPALSLAEARAMALVEMGKAEKGGDPALDRKRAREEARHREVRTVADLAEALFEAGGVRPSTDAYRRWLWRKHLKPSFGDTRPEDVAPGRTRRFIREIGTSAGGITANRSLALLKRILNFGVEEEHIGSNPIARVGPTFVEVSRARVLTEAELAALWEVAERTKAPVRQGTKQRDDLAVSRAMAIGVLLCAVTLQRAGEVAGVRRSELDLDAKLWLLPAERSKSRREHVIPLTDAAIALIREALALADLRRGDRQASDADPLFPSPRDAARPVARMSLGRAMARMCRAADIENASAHDLRRTGATMMASERIGVLSEVVSRVLNHAPPGPRVSGIYNRHRYLPEKRRALEAWEGQLMEIVVRPRRQIGV